jgi:hypothetical protein
MPSFNNEAAETDPGEAILPAPGNWLQAITDAIAARTLLLQGRLQQTATAAI